MTKIFLSDTGRRERCFNNSNKFARGGDNIPPEQKYFWFVTAHFGDKNQLDLHRHCKHFRNVIDRKILKPEQRLYKMLWIEEGRGLHTAAKNTAHSHWLFEQPQHLDEQIFKSIFTDLWKNICGSSNIKFVEVLPQLGGYEGIINYCVKEADVDNLGTFIEPCSDNARIQANRQSIHDIYISELTRNAHLKNMK